MYSNHYTGWPSKEECYHIVAKIEHQKIFNKQSATQSLVKKRRRNTSQKDFYYIYNRKRKNYQGVAAQNVDVKK